MLRPTIPDDKSRLMELTFETGLFLPHDIDMLEGVLEDYFDSEAEENEEAGHYCYTYEQHHRIIGYVYFAETEMAERVWYLWWIAVDKSVQGQGVGKEMLLFAENEARRREGRLMFIETSGISTYEPTRRFYLKNGYEREAVLRDYYREGDDLVVFRKRLTT